MEHSSESGYFLQQIYSSLSLQDIHLQALDTAALTNPMYLNVQYINRLLEIEMKRIKENYMHMEREYVEQKLQENPITIERRTNNNNHQQQSSSEDEIDVVSVNATVEKENNKFLQQQRAEACRRSRYNNKIKKAKSKYRHRYISQKLLQNTQMYSCLQDLIVRAERQLLVKGLLQEDLQHLRHSYGVEKAIEAVRKLDRTIKTEA